MKKLFVLPLISMFILCAGCGGGTSKKENPYAEHKTAPITYSERVYYEMYEKMPKANIFQKEREDLFEELSEFDNQKSIKLRKAGGGMFSTPHLEVTDAVMYDFDYKGEVKNGKPHGVGVIGYRGIKEYCGYFEDGVPEGYGIWYSASLLPPKTLLEPKYNVPYYNNPILYEGESADWNPQGKGVRFKYTGLDVQGLNVSGMLYVYVGEFDGTDIDGDFDVYASLHGTTLYPVYLRKFDGYYEKEEYIDFPEGHTYHCYTGEVDSGQFDGEGTSYYLNGNTHFKGEFKRNRITNNGVMYAPNGTKLFDNT